MQVSICASIVEGFIKGENKLRRRPSSVARHKTEENRHEVRTRPLIMMERNAGGPHKNPPPGICRPRCDIFVSAMRLQRELTEMSRPAVKYVFVPILTCGVLCGCAQIKEAGRTVGHTTRDVTTEIGHGARDVTREIGHGTRDVVREVGEGTSKATKAATEEVKKVTKPAPTPSEY